MSAHRTAVVRIDPIETPGDAKAEERFRSRVNCYDPWER